MYASSAHHPANAIGFPDQGQKHPDSDPNTLFPTLDGGVFTVAVKAGREKIMQELTCNECKNALTGRSVKTIGGNTQVVSIWQIAPSKEGDVVVDDDDDDDDDDDVGCRVHHECKKPGKNYSPDASAVKMAKKITGECAVKKEGVKCGEKLPLHELDGHFKKEHADYCLINEVKKIEGRVGVIENDEFKRAERDFVNAKNIRILFENVESNCMSIKAKDKQTGAVQASLGAVVERKCQEFSQKITLFKHEVSNKMEGIDDSLRSQVLGLQASLKENVEHLYNEIAKTNKSNKQQYGGATASQGGLAQENHELRSELETCKQELEICKQLATASYDGTLLWKIEGVLNKQQEAISGKTCSLYSDPFYTSKFGYKMCARIYLNGDGMGKDTHVSLFFVVMKGNYDALLKWPFAQRVTLILLDQNTGTRSFADKFNPDAVSSSFKRPTSDMNTASGCPFFVDKKVLQDSTYVKDNTMFIKMIVDTSNLYM